MADIEKVVAGLEHCKKYGSLCGLDCNGHYEFTDHMMDVVLANEHRHDCPYGLCETGCVVTLTSDALEIIKEQVSLIHFLKHQRQKGHWVFGNTQGHSWMKCSQCLVSQSGHTACFSFCPNCGASMEEKPEYVY